MYEQSNGSLRRGASPFPAALALTLFGGVTVAVAGCPGPEPHTGLGGAGGSPASSSSTSSSSTASSSSSASSTSSSTTSSSSSTSSSTGGMTCTAADDCPVPDTLCKLPTCEGNVCKTQPAMKSASCKDSGGKVCDGNGECVDCVLQSDCAVANTPCMGTVYTPPPTCSSNVCTTPPTIDCAQMKLACKPNGCLHCTVDADCAPPSTGTCATVKCLSNLCEPTNLPLGTPCIDPTGTGSCNGSGACKSGKYVFVSEGVTAGNFGGTAGADMACQKFAQSVGFKGTWFSWTSDSQTPPPATRFTQSLLAPYRLIDDTIVADNWAGLTSGALQHPINMTQNKTTVTQGVVWTGTTPMGTLGTPNCADWAPTSGAAAMGVVGNATAMDTGWTKFQNPACTTMAHLYCFEQ